MINNNFQCFIFQNYYFIVLSTIQIELVEYVLSREGREISIPREHVPTDQIKTWSFVQLIWNYIPNKIHFIENILVWEYKKWSHYFISLPCIVNCTPIEEVEN